MLSLDRPIAPDWAAFLRHARARRALAELQTAEARFRLALHEIAELSATEAAEAPALARRALDAAP